MIIKWIIDMKVPLSRKSCTFNEDTLFRNTNNTSNIRKLFNIIMMINRVFVFVILFCSCYFIKRIPLLIIGKINDK